MAEKYRVRISALAQGQLLDITDYIRDRSPQGARRMGEKLKAAIDGLELFPKRFRMVEMPSEGEPSVRSMPVPPYIVRYDVDENEKVVNVLTVRHGARPQR